MNPLLADIILYVHALFVLFVVGGQVLIVIGLISGWQWVRCYWFRLLHVCAIAFVVLESWLGVMCPLTVWENLLRMQGQDHAYGDSFIRYWVRELLFYEAPTWVFTLIYSIFFVIVLMTWYWGPPQRKKH